MQNRLHDEEEQFAQKDPPQFQGGEKHQDQEDGREEVVAENKREIREHISQNSPHRLACRAHGGGEENRSDGSPDRRAQIAKSKPPMARPLTRAAASVSHPQRNSGFPDTYIAQISVQLDDPDHPVTLTWAGPNGSAQETGPFRSSPGAGLRGLNCDSETTSRRSGSTCTPKGTFLVTGFASQLNSHPEAKDVTWFVPARGIALHYYPSVPKYAASHGCVRLQLRRVAQLIKNNSRAGLTSVVVEGTWTKPPHQY